MLIFDFVNFNIPCERIQVVWHKLHHIRHKWCFTDEIGFLFGNLGVVQRYHFGKAVVLAVKEQLSIYLLYAANVPRRIFVFNYINRRKRNYVSTFLEIFCIFKSIPSGVKINRRASFWFGIRKRLYFTKNNRQMHLHIQKYVLQ